MEMNVVEEQLKDLLAHSVKGRATNIIFQVLVDKGLIFLMVDGNKHLLMNDLTSSLVEDMVKIVIGKKDGEEGSEIPYLFSVGEEIKDKLDEDFMLKRFHITMCPQGFELHVGLFARRVKNGVLIENLGYGTSIENAFKEHETSK
jgi:hypothetical protein